MIKLFSLIIAPGCPGLVLESTSASVISSYVESFKLSLIPIASAHTNYLINLLKNPATPLQGVAVELEYSTALPIPVKPLLQCRLTGIPANLPSHILPCSQAAPKTDPPEEPQIMKSISISVNYFFVPVF